MLNSIQGTKKGGRTTINLAPGDLRKEGPSFDLPMAIGILAATGQLADDVPKDLMISGELSLSGETRAIKGGLPMALLAKRLGFRGILLPPKSSEEAALVEGVSVYPVGSLSETVRFLNGDLTIAALPSYSALEYAQEDANHHLDFSEIKGQTAAKRAIEIAVAGNHNLLILWYKCLFWRFLSFASHHSKFALTQ